MARPARRLAIVALAGLLLGLAVYATFGALTTLHRTTPVFDPPVLAGQQLWGACTGGFYARRGDSIVLTSTGHCTTEGRWRTTPDGVTVRGVFGPAARDATCPYPGHRCASSDINYLVVAPDRIPWGHLNVVDLGTAGYRVIPRGTKALGCADIAIGDLAEIDGRNSYRSGSVPEKNDLSSRRGRRLLPLHGGRAIQVGVGDSGGAVLVRGIPAGVTFPLLRWNPGLHAAGGRAGPAGPRALHDA